MFFTMHIFAVILAVCILTVGLIVARIQNPSLSNIYRQKEVLSEKVLPTQTPTYIPTPFPTSVPKDTQIDSYKYPNSSVISSSGNSLSLQSDDMTDVITGWYKEKIENEGMSVTTFVKTRANDKVLNKLVGVKEDEQINVEISQEGAGQTVDISVSFLNESDN
ncbi:MAG: hypothetical protein UT40_C0014G0023 [Candidatus Woesebacteria bacterium GW2011_GWA1_39_21b]|uniref:Uncharacterized protein n=3 Tax=Candidatus Woeseibacteriota TaxID=1752722 RepID=A0A0G0RIU5_9BACT|nr:MAG: hypothetical protein US72_C0018G0020 [Microgenomates group bacterium GW2011_GWC1_38_12]KKR13567.1 MAG: hypothetical protein UT40_C0014G0023 [Candidatus Woesebacteria bacterium GW2011_GWA1_39_21b]